MKTFSTKYLFCLLSLLIFLFFGTPVRAADTLEKIAKSGAISLGFSSSPPFSYFNEKQHAVGYSIDLCLSVIEAVKKELKRPDIVIKYKLLSGYKRIPAIVFDEVDLECGSMSNTEERREKIAFAPTSFIAQIRLLVHKGSDIKESTDLANKKVVVTQGSTSEVVLNEINKTLQLNVQAILGKNSRESFALFEKQKGEVLISDDILLYTRQASAKNSENFVIKRLVLGTEHLALAMRKNDPEFKAIVDTEITRLITTGEIDAIYKKWFESPIPPKKINLRYPMSELLRESFKQQSEATQK